MSEKLFVDTKPQSIGRVACPDEVVEDITRWEELFHVADEGAQVTRNLCELIERYDLKGVRIHDASIAATMLANGIRKLFTWNVRDFEKITELELVSFTR